MSIIGDNIMQCRKKLGLTQEELASRLGYKSKSTINKIELGINDIPQSKVVKFANALGTTPAHLMGWDREAIENSPTEMAERHFEMIMDEDLNEIFDYLKSMDAGKRKIAKGLIRSLAETEA